MGTEYPNRPIRPPPSTPFAAAPPTMAASSLGSEPIPPVYNRPSFVPPPPSTTFHRFPSPSIQQPSAPPTYYPQQPPVPMGFPPSRGFPLPTANPVLPNANFPPPPGSAAQPSLPGYASAQSNVAFQAPPRPQSPYFTQQPGSYVPTQPPTTASQFGGYQGGYTPPPPMGAQMGQMQHPGSVPPVNSAQGLAEDFNSLSLGSVPGALDPGLDPKELPRPLEGDVEPNSFAEMYPQNCHSRYLRLTTGAIPNSQSLASRWQLPLGAVVCPLAEAPEGEEVAVLNFASTGIIRCRRCRTYVNPYVTFSESGRKWRCNICSLTNDVPSDYFSALDATGRRFDLDHRPELLKGSVEFVAPTEYMVRPPMPPLYFFLIDVSVSAVASGMVEVVAETIKSCLDRLPGFPRTQIGFITYDSTIHFYNMKSSLTQPQMLVVSDLDNIFVPLPDDLLVNLSESRTVVDSFLDTLPSMFRDNMNLESAFGPALKAAFMVMSQLGGKLLVFQNTLPSLSVGRLKLRGDDPRVYGTDKEQTLRIPEDPFYKQMAADFTKYQIGVDIYALSGKYTDIASLGTLAKYTGGQVYYYPNFQSAIHGDKLRHELARNLTRETAWEAVMRVRCGKGIRFSSYHGNFMLRSTDLLALPAIDCDKAYAMQLSLEETLLTTQTVYFQVALLYTASCGERRIRVHTAAAPVVADLGEMYRQADTGAIVSLFSRLAIEKTLSHKLEEARSSVQLRIVKAFKEYRNLYAVQHRLGARMIYPESLKFLLLYGLALCKSAPLRGGQADVSLDERCAAGYTMMSLPVKKLLKLLYPSLIRVDDYLLKPSAPVDQCIQSIKRLPPAAESLDSRGLYILDDGFHFVLWFGKMLSPEVYMNLLGPDFATELSRVTLTEHETEMSKKLTGILKKLRDDDPSYYKVCHLVRQGEQPRESFLLLKNLVEDQLSGMNGYADWVLQIHRQVQQN